MKMTYVLVGYVVVALVLAVAVDVAAKSSFDSSARNFEKELAAAADMATDEGEPELVAANGEGASRNSCEKFFEVQREMAVELALAFAPQKGKKAKKQRTRMRNEINAKMNEAKDQIVSACMEVPQAEITCVLETDDAMQWGECGPNIAKLQAK